MERRPEIPGAIRAANSADQRMLSAIYYMPGYLAGPVAHWSEALERARRMGFRAVCSAPLSLPGRRGDLFLAADHDKPDPRLGSFASTQAAIATAAAAARKAKLELLIDVV